MGSRAVLKPFEVITILERLGFMEARQKVKKVHWFKVTAFKRLAGIVGEY
jgi:hypothetical protein